MTEREWARAIPGDDGWFVDALGHAFTADPDTEEGARFVAGEINRAVRARVEEETRALQTELAALTDPQLVTVPAQDVDDLRARLADAEREKALLRAELATHAACIKEIEADQLEVAKRDNQLHEEKDRRLATLAARVEALEGFLRSVKWMTALIDENQAP